MYLIGYVAGSAYEVRITVEFRRWLDRLRDARGKARVLARIDRLSDGHAGDCLPIGGGISEMRIHVGPGYRLYFAQRGAGIVVLLAGGNKDTQSTDIRRAQALADQLARDTDAQDTHY